MSHIAPISFLTNATIPAYRIVTLLTGTANTVKICAAATDRPLGITADTNLTTSQAIPVICYGLARLQFNETMTCGKMVTADASGLGTPHVDTTAGSYVVGVLVGAVIAVTGTVADVLVQPHFKSIP